MTASLFIALDVIFGIFAFGQLARRPRQTVARSAGGWAPSHRPIHARIRVGDFEARGIRPHALVSLRIAPTDAPGTALELSDGRGEEAIRLSVQDVVGIRVWLHGRPVPVVCHSHEATQTALQPLSADIAGWELELCTRSGELVRCYGEDVSPAAEEHLARLQRLLAVEVRSAAPALHTFAGAGSANSRGWQPIAS